MELHFHLYSVLLLIAGGVAGLTSVFTFSRAGSAGKLFSTMMGLVTVWVLAYAFELATRNLEEMLFWIRIEYIGIALIPAFWLLFCLQFTGYDTRLIRKMLPVIFLMPVITLLMVWSNDWHQLHYSATSVAQYEHLYLLDIEVGPWYVIHTIIFYSYLLIGIALLMRKHAGSNRFVQKQLSTILIGAIVPWVANIIYISGFRPYDHLDITPFAFVVTGIVISIGLLKFRLFEFLPVAREKIVDGMQEGILILDEKLQLLDTNPAMRQLLNRDEMELTGQSVYDLFAGQDALLEMFDQDNPSAIEHKIELNGSVLVFEVNLVPLVVKNDLPTGYTFMFRNITRQKESESEIIRAREQAEAASRSKSDFLAHMSHEIRTPLNGIIGFVDLLMKSNLNTNQYYYMSNVHTSARHLLSIVNDILDLSKIEAGKMELDLKKTDLRELCHRMMEMFDWKADQNNLDLKLVISPDLPRFILADEVRLQQVLINLLGNAIKFTEEGHVTLLVEIPEQTSVEGDVIRFSVCDTGPGIAKENLKRIFESFTQEDFSTTRKFQGTGLGLPISNKLLSLMESTLQLDSTPGEGSRFYFDLPCSAIGTDQVGETPSVDGWPAEYTNLPKQPDQVIQPYPHKFSVLIVEDNPVNRLLLESILNLYFPKAVVISVKDGHEALERFRGESPDLIFMDIQMPGMSGYEITERIRSIETGSRVPIIAITAGIINEDEEAYVKSGMDDFLTKPVEPQVIEKMILKWAGDGPVAEPDS